MEITSKSYLSPLSTPHNDGNFNIYDGIRDKLLDLGIPKDQIAYIHNAASEAQKKELFGKVRSGEIRVLIGSTQKMGAGTNVQKKLSPCTMSIARGDRLIYSSAKAALSVRAMRTRKLRFTPM